jgi:hypothetical protein
LNGCESSASIEAQSFHSTSDSPLRVTDPVGRSASALNQPVSRMALKSLLPQVQYRVSVHGTPASKDLPAFHTQNKTMLSRRVHHIFAKEFLAKGEGSTGVRYTGLPAGGSPLYRQAVHGATGVSYTETRHTTGGSCTNNGRKWPKKLTFFRANCTKLSSTKHNNRAVVLLGMKGGV